MTIDARARSRLSRPAPDRAQDYRRRARVGDLLVIGLWLSAAVAVALFLVAGGTARFGSVTEIITSAGIVTGLVGTDFVLAMLVLAARVPFIDRAIGHDRAIAVHRALGKPAFYLLVSHGILLLIGYGLSTGITPFAEIRPMIAIPDIPLAIAGLGLMAVVVVSSFAAV